jgi:hypothetical protein
MPRDASRRPQVLSDARNPAPGRTLVSARNSVQAILQDFSLNEGAGLIERSVNFQALIDVKNGNLKIGFAGT